MGAFFYFLLFGSVCLKIRYKIPAGRKQKIMPNDYKAMLNLIVQMEERGLSSEQAQMEAFNMKANAGK